MDLKFDQQLMSQIVSKAILEGVSAEQRDTLLAAAVDALITPERGSYGVKPKTPIQEAFEAAAKNACHQVAAQMIAEDPQFMQTVRDLTREAIDKALSADTWEAEEVRRKILGAIAESAAASSNWQ